MAHAALAAIRNECARLYCHYAELAKDAWDDCKDPLYATRMDERAVGVAYCMHECEKQLAKLRQEKR